MMMKYTIIAYVRGKGSGNSSEIRIAGIEASAGPTIGIVSKRKASTPIISAKLLNPRK